MKIRKAKLEDAKMLATLNRNTIRKVNSKDYSKKVIDHWSSAITTKGFRKRIIQSNRKYLVVEIDNKVVGYVLVEKEQGIIKALYVNHDYHRKGIGKKLLKRAESELRKLGIKKSTIQCSLTAIPFYSSQGYKKIRKGFSEMNGVKIEHLLMSKKI